MKNTIINKTAFLIFILIMLPSKVFMQETGSLCGFLLRGTENDSLQIENATLLNMSEIIKPDIINENFFIYHNLIQPEYELKIEFVDGRSLNRKIFIKKDSLTTISIFSLTGFYNSFRLDNNIFDSINIDTLYVKNFTNCGGIEGYVKPFPANVHFLRLGWGARTDTIGHFLFPYLPPGKYVLEAYGNYDRHILTGVEVKQGETSIVNFSLPFPEGFDVITPWIPRYKKYKNKTGE